MKLIEPDVENKLQNSESKHYLNPPPCVEQKYSIWLLWLLLCNINRSEMHAGRVATGRSVLNDHVSRIVSLHISECGVYSVVNKGQSSFILPQRTKQTHGFHTLPNPSTPPKQTSMLQHIQPSAEATSWLTNLFLWGGGRERQLFLWLHNFVPASLPVWFREHLISCL